MHISLSLSLPPSLPLSGEDDRDIDKNEDDRDIDECVAAFVIVQMVATEVRTTVILTRAVVMAVHGGGDGDLKQNRQDKL